MSRLNIISVMSKLHNILIYINVYLISKSYFNIPPLSNNESFEFAKQMNYIILSKKKKIRKEENILVN